MQCVVPTFSLIFAGCLVYNNVLSLSLSLCLYAELQKIYICE